MMMQGISESLLGRLRQLDESDALPDSRLSVEVRRMLRNRDRESKDKDMMSLAKMLSSFINPKLYDAAFGSKSEIRRQSSNGEVDMDKLRAFMSSKNMEHS